VGKALVASLEADGHDVVVVTRSPDGPGQVGWDAAPRQVDGADAVVNLAGVSIGGPRWTRKRKDLIRSSRLDTTRALREAIEAAAERPPVFVTASGIDFAGDAGDAVVDEDAPYGRSFLAAVCAAWEASGAAAPVRHVAVRTPLTIGPDAHAVRLMALPFRLFAGGRIGDGRQWFPWIHLDDLVRVFRLAIDDESLSGPVVAVAPQLLRQRDAARDFGAVLHRPSRVPTPAPLLRVALGEQADLLLHGQRAVSQRLNGFDFRYPALRAALETAL
jgi:uncharacterized protein (TIGR01777 family)